MIEFHIATLWWSISTLALMSGWVFTWEAGGNLGGFKSREGIGLRVWSAGGREKEDEQGG